ncbi:MAG: restriction endonuclease subunit S [Bacteroidales bacterium]|nr:restriction endonuclease subunit S [Bacteroidales bacterium]
MKNEIMHSSYPTYKLGEVAEVILGQSPDSKSYNTSHDGLPFFQGKSEFTEWHPIPNKWCTEPKKIAEPLDILLSVRAPVGPTNVAKERCCIGRGLAAIRYPDCYKYVLYYLRSVSKFLESKATGTTFAAISGDVIKNLPIPLPPLPTQRAIVTRIETLFAELDKGVEKLKTAQQQLKVYRQAVLNDAYDGNLTIEWRKNNHIDNNTWKEVTFAEIAEIKCNLVDVNDYGDFPHIAPDNIEKESGRLLEYHTVAEDGVISGKHRFFSGQILYSKIRPNLSKVVIADFDGLCSADMYPIEAKENTKFLFYQMLSSKFVDYASNSGSRTVLPKINQKSLSIIPMKVCTLPEQQRIVQEIETRLSQAELVEASIEQSLQQAEALRQSILKKAFSGELV